MGCAFSKGSAERRGTIYGRRNTIVMKTKVNIRAGEGIKFGNKNGTKIIFIFGGPGSGKGTIVNNLVEMYNFRFVCGEDLILEKLSERLLPTCAETGTGTRATQQLQTLLQEDSSSLTLDWVLELIEQEIVKYPGDTLLVDIVPNLKFLLRVPTFMKSCIKEMKAFEERHPVAFAIDLSLDKDHLISNINQTHACTKAPTSGQASGDKSSSDEMDTSRTQRRFNIYLNSVQEFLTYFEGDARLVTVDTSCGKVDAVWDSVRDYVLDSQIAEPCKGLEQVLLFKMSTDDFDDVDRERYPMVDLACKDLVTDYQSAPPGKILKKLLVEMRKNAVDAKTFMLDACDTYLCNAEKLDQMINHKIMFLELEVGQLDFFIHGLRRKTERKKSLARKREQFYKSICTSDNEALIFPESTDTEICRKLVLGYMNAK